MHINNMATVETLDNSIRGIVTAALVAGFRVFAHKGNRGPSSFVEACLDTEGSFVTVCKPSHRWDDAGISAPVKPNKVWGSSVLVDYDGTTEDAIRAILDVCESDTVQPRFVGNVPPVPNYGKNVITSWPGKENAFAEITF